MAGLLAAVEVARDGQALRRKLKENADYSRGELRALGLDTGASTTHVIPLIVRDRARLYEAGLQLRARGLYVVPIDYPAVPEDAVRFRISISAAHTRADLDEALDVIEGVLA